MLVTIFLNNYFSKLNLHTYRKKVNTYIYCNRYSSQESLFNTDLESLQ